MKTHSPDNLTVFRIFYFVSNDHQFGLVYMVIYDIYFSFVVSKENKNVSSKDIYF